MVGVLLYPDIDTTRARLLDGAPRLAETPTRSRAFGAFLTSVGSLGPPLGVPAKELDAQAHEEALATAKVMAVSQVSASVSGLCASCAPQLAASTFEAFAMKKASVTNALGLMATIAPMTARITPAPAICPKPCM